MQNWSEAELQKFIDTGQEEHLELEFKRSTSKEDAAKTEISKDVSAFANTIGGTIIYGIDEHPESPHQAVRINPIDPRAISKEWLEQVINSRIQPRITGVRIVSIDLPNTERGRVAYAVEIPESSTAHQAYDNRYYRRFNFQSIAMADHEIRQAMNRASKPAYQVWFRPYISIQHAKGTGVSFRATVVNISEVTPTAISAILYLPRNAFGLGGEAWDFVFMGQIQFRRFEGTIRTHWHPGQPSQVDFEQASQLLPKVTFAGPMRVHLKLFDSFGLGLRETYDIAVPDLSHTVTLSESDRKPSATFS